MSTPIKIGIKTPFITLFHKDTELSLKVVAFEYKYSQEQDDVCQIKIQTNQVTIADEPYCQPGAELKVTWGYKGFDSVLEPITATRKVYVREISTEYDNSQWVTVDLLCTDKASYLNKSGNNQVHKDTDAKKLAEDLGIQYGLRVSLTQSDETFKPDGNTTTEIDNTSTKVLKPYNEKGFLSGLKLVVPQANKTNFQVLKEVVNKTPGGPYEVYGRDDTLFIRKRPYGKKPIKSYVYAESREFISFTPKKKTRTRKKAGVNTTTVGFDHTKKEGYEMYSNPLTNPEDTQGSKVNTPDIEYISQADQPSTPPPTVPGNVESVKRSFNDFKEFQKKLKDLPIETVTGNSGEPLQYIKRSTQSDEIFKRDGNITTEIDKTRVMYRGIGFNETIISIEDKPKDAKDESQNIQAQQQEREEPGTVVLEGDPHITSGELITIENVAKVHSGNWYIQECSHVVSRDGGYTLTLSVTRNARQPSPNAINQTETPTTPNNQKGPEDSQNTKDLPNQDPNKPITNGSTSPNNIPEPTGVGFWERAIASKGANKT